MMWQQELPNRHLIYDEIQKGDLGKVVLATMNIMKIHHLIQPASNIFGKSQQFSEIARTEGNQAYTESRYQQALEFYNKALLLAPKKSQALALAYSNRSALLFTMKQYQACLKDVEMSLDLGCPPHVVDKLYKRKRDAESKLTEENFIQNMRSTIGKNLFDFNDFSKNRHIPCASSDIEVIVESGIPKVVAAKNVKVGAVLAIEKAFFSSVEENFTYAACYYCQSVNPNLLPCDGCCAALFCNENCKQKCMAEYHNIECKILVRNDMIVFMQAAIKLKNMFSSWKEFIEASNLLSLDRIKKSKIEEVYNGQNKFSLLNFYNDRHFLHGRLYNFALKFSQILNALIETNIFFPKQTEEKESAILAFSRVMMYMSLNIPFFDLMSCVSVLKNNINEIQQIGHGMFPFLGKLPHCCAPNALMVGLNNQIACIAIRPITPGTKITVSYAGHRLDYNHVFRQDTLLIRYGVCCLCDLCRGIPWKTYEKPSEAQMRIYDKLNPKRFENIDIFNIQQTFNLTFKALAVFDDLQFCEKYCEIYTLFRKCLLDIQDSYTRNVILSAKERY